MNCAESFVLCYCFHVEHTYGSVSVGVGKTETFTTEGINEDLILCKQTYFERVSMDSA